MHPSLKNIACNYACSYGYKVVCVDTKIDQCKYIKVKIQLISLLRKCLKKLNIVKNHEKNIIKKDSPDKRTFQMADKYHVRDKLCDRKHVRVRDHCQVIAEYRGSFHQVCDTNFQLRKKKTVIFHNIRGFDSHNLMLKIGKFGQEIDVITNGMDIYGFYIRKRISFHYHFAVHEFRFRKFGKKFTKR